MGSIAYRLWSFLLLAVCLCAQTLFSLPAEFETLLERMPAGHFYSNDDLRKLLNGYTPEELTNIHTDFLTIQETTFAVADQRREYLFTAGGPSSGKTTLLEKLLEQNPTHYAYIDADNCLKQMQHSYGLDHTRNAVEAQQYWHNASSFIANVLLGYALRDGYAIAHGTSMASQYTRTVLEAIHQYGYTILMIHVTCAEEVRIASELARRERGVFQCTDEEFNAKQRSFVSLLPEYMGLADSIFFYYRGEMDSMVLAAQKVLQEILYWDTEALKAIEMLHNALSGEGFWSHNVPNPKT